jgi:hypothetical protein
MASTEIALASQRESIRVPRVAELPWVTSPKPGGVPGGAKKILGISKGGAMAIDPELEVTTALAHIPPGWVDEELVYHPCVEEAYVLEGEGFMADRPRNKGWYLYRPPGILHGPAGQPPYASRVMVQRFAAAGGLLRYDGDEFPHVDSQPVTDDHERWPVGWVESLDASALPWLPVEGGPWGGTEHKWLSRNKVTGGGALLLRLPQDWIGTGTETRGSVEEFVVDGELTMGGQWFERWGYASRPIGDAAGVYHAPGGACLICFWDVDELSG